MIKMIELLDNEKPEVYISRVRQRLVETTMDCINLKEKIISLEERVAELEKQVEELGGTERIVIADERNRSMVLGANSKEWVRSAIYRLQKKMKPIHVENIKKEMVCLLDDDKYWDADRYRKIVKLLKKYEQENIDIVDLVST